ncbi:MAG TPA: flagellar export chaperone FliS [Gemmatimonadaceae bacterium]|nr:flagellar export chaperone FliS [Gemmatimonadaceae bacterium]
MSYASPAAQYQEIAVRSASPAQLVVMVYDHLLLQLRRARLAMEQGNVELRGTSLERARAALGELLVTLDHERGGEISRQLSGVYTFLLAELVELGLRPSPARLDRVAAMVADLRESFAAITGRATAAREVA